MVKGFQHSQPQSVYRQKNRTMLMLMLPLSLAMFGIGVYRFVATTSGDVFLPIMMLISLVNFSQMFFRIRLTMSPTGISVTTDRRLATAWTNVESLQFIPLGFLIKREVPCLVLRESLGKHWLGSWGAPAELKGRLIPIHPAVWERMLTLQDELYGYLKANAVIRNELSVPIDFASISQRQKQFTWKLGAVLMGLLVLPLIGLLVIMF